MKKLNAEFTEDAEDAEEFLYCVIKLIFIFDFKSLGFKSVFYLNQLNLKNKWEQPNFVFKNVIILLIHNFRFIKRSKEYIERGK